MDGPDRRLRAMLSSLSVRSRIARVLPATIRRSFLAKFLTALVLLLVLGTAVGTVFFFGISETLDRQVDTEVRATTQMHTTIYDNWFETREQTLSSVADLNFMSGGSLEQASQRLSLETAKSDIFIQIHLLSLDSGEVLASSSDRAIGRNYYELAVDETILTQGDSFVYPGRFRSLDNRNVVALLTRLPSANRVVVAEVDPEAGPNPPQTVTGASTFVVTDDGQVVFGDATLSRLPPDGGDFTAVVRRDQSLLTFRQLPESQLVVVRKTPVDAAFAVKDAVLFSFASTLVLVFGILVVVSFVGGRGAASDLRRLVDKADAIASGDLDVEFTTARRDEIGQLYEALLEMRDALRERITEAEAAREDAQDAKAEIEEQKAIISVLNRVLRHNIRNDLTVIKGHNTALRQQLDEDLEHFEKIESHTEDLLDKADKAREIERLVSADEQLLETIDAAAVVRAEIERFEREYPDVDITSDVPDEASVRAHDALDFVISNLVENAIVHNDSPRPRVDIELERIGERVEITVADNGPGIPDVELTMLDEGHETAFEHGSGLGLWLVNWLVMTMDGDLEFERRKPTGTIMTVTLQAGTDRSRVPARDETAT